MESKLPEEIRKQIIKESEDAMLGMDRKIKPGITEEPRHHFLTGYQEGYGAGATEWAQWKVKHDDLERESFDVEKKIKSIELAYGQLKERCEKMETILKEAYEEHLKEKELLISRYPTLFPGIENYIKPWVNKAAEALKEGESNTPAPVEGKEVDNG